jgi:hypothetical protein
MIPRNDENKQVYNVVMVLGFLFLDKINKFNILIMF